MHKNKIVIYKLVIISPTIKGDRLNLRSVYIYKAQKHVSTQSSGHHSKVCLYHIYQIGLKNSEIRGFYSIRSVIRQNSIRYAE